MDRMWEEDSFTLRYLKFKNTSYWAIRQEYLAKAIEYKAWAQTWIWGVLRMPLCRSDA